MIPSGDGKIRFSLNVIYLCVVIRNEPNPNSGGKAFATHSSAILQKDVHSKNSCKCPAFVFSYYRFEWAKAKKKTKHIYNARISIYWMTHRMSISIRFAPKTAQKKHLPHFELSVSDFFIQMSTTHWINFHSSEQDRKNVFSANECECYDAKHVMPRKPN